MNFFNQLQQHTAAGRAYLYEAPLFQHCFSQDVSIADYVAFLTQAFHHVKHTVPLLMAVGARLPHSQEWLREAIAHYIEEEIGHQEWILKDIQHCGFDAEAVRHSTPTLATELMVAYAYDTVTRGNPLGFFGMVHVLEGTSIASADAAADALQQTLKLPNKAFTYLRSHGAIDIEHVKFFEDLMNRIENPVDQAHIIHCANAFYQLYGNVLRAVLTDQHQRRAA